MTVRNFNNVTSVGTLTGPVASSATTLGVQNLSNLPTAPFTITVDRNTPTEEICLVTAVAGGTLTVTRGFDGTAAVAHSAGATVEHTAGAIEYIEANAHVNATANVHGVSGGLVGTDGAQSLFAKTLVSPVVQADPVAGDAVVAWVPPAAPTRNLFRGMNTAGADVITVDAAGNVLAQNVHAAGTGQVDGLLTAAGGVTVPAGKTVAANGGITTTTVNTTGNVTVGGSETVTGTLAVTGAITGPSVAMVQQASDPAGTASQETLYAKTDGGIYRRAGTGAVARVPVHWGSGTAYPASPLPGDQFIRTDLGNAYMRWNGTNWRQAEVTEVATAAARNAITAPYGGFRVLQTDAGVGYEWRAGSSNSWWKVYGPKVAVLDQAIDSAMFVAANNGVDKFGGTTSFNFTIDFCGDLHANMTCEMSWDPQNAAWYWGFDVQTSAGVQVRRVVSNRFHNNNTGGATWTPFETSGIATIPSAGSYRLIPWMRVDPNSNSILDLLNVTFNAWI